VRTSLLRRRAPSRGPAESAADADAASAVQRLAVLLEAGLAPARAWAALAEAGDPVAAKVAAADGRVGDTLAAADGAWPQVAVAWRVADTVGAPLAGSLRGFAAALRDAQQSRDDVRVALADPQATAKLVAWLPLVAVFLGIALGFDVVAALSRPLGIVGIGAGLALMITARAWTKRLVRGAQPPPGLPGLRCDLLAIALSSGVSVDRAEEVVAAAGGGDADPETDAVVRLSRATGAPAVELLRAAAADARHRSRTDGRLRAARLGSRLLLPLGLCTLPAFLLLGVGPMLLSVLSGGVVPP
jgi:tight adherence protein B